MDLHKLPPDDPIAVKIGFTQAWRSQPNAQWMVGFRPILFGVRVTLLHNNPYGGCYDDLVLDYCAGADTAFQMELLGAIAIVLHRLPETIDPHIVQRMFPTFAIKPINNDPACWQEIQAMAGLLDLSKTDSLLCPKCRNTIYNPQHIRDRQCRYCFTKI